MEARKIFADTPETLGALELSGIARGYRVVDRMIKTAPIVVHEASPYCPGKFLVIVSGDVASVDEALQAGEAAAGDSFWGRLFIPNLTPGVVAAVNRDPAPAAGETVGILESFSAVSIIEAADAGLKAANVTLAGIRLLDGIGGKAFLVFSGELPDVEASMDAGRGRIPDDMFVDAQLVPQFSRDLVRFLGGRG